MSEKSNDDQQYEATTMKRLFSTAILAIASFPTIALAQEEAITTEAYSGPAWSPYLVGALIGILSMFTFYFSKHPLGASTAYARIAGFIGQGVAPKHTNQLKYFADNKPKIGWELMLVVGVVVGGFLAAFSGGEFTGRVVPELWQQRFGEGTASTLLRIVAAFSGGVLMAFGARLAGGCTSGHGISGTMQLSVGSWITAGCMFIGGIATAMLMFAF
ncbi:MAG: YeeE/YedE family protein [Planctomycetaceae bacterium]|nr:YeeE/YedE family protein [Planctomycetaceae bacterium]